MDDHAAPDPFGIRFAVARVGRGFGARRLCLHVLTSDEYENALISERRAQGRYGVTRRRWPMVAFVGGCVMVLGTVLLFA